MASKTLQIVLSIKNKLQAGLAAAHQQMQAAGRAIGTAFKAAAAGVAAVGAAIAAAMKSADAFRGEIAKIASVTNMGTAEAAAAVKKLSRDYGIAGKDAAEAFAAAAQAGIPASALADFLDTMGKASTTGLGSVAEITGAVTAALNAYGLTASAAASVTDTLLVSVQNGAGSFADMQSALARLAPLAASSGVSLQDVSAALATLSRGSSPARATREIAGAITALNKSLGDGWSDTMTFHQGLEAMRTAASGSREELQRLTGNTETVNAVMLLTGENAAAAAKDIAAIAAAAGAVEGAFAKAGDLTPFSRMTAAVKGLATSLGDVALAGLGGFMDEATESMGRFQARVDRFFAGGGGGLVVAQWCEEARANIAAFVAQAIPLFQALGTAIRESFAYASEVSSNKLTTWRAQLNEAASGMWQKWGIPGTENPFAAAAEKSRPQAAKAEENLAALREKSLDLVYQDTRRTWDLIAATEEQRQNEILEIAEKYAKKRMDADRRDAEEAKRNADETARAEENAAARAAAAWERARADEAAAAEDAKGTAEEEPLPPGKGDREREAAADARAAVAEIAAAKAAEEAAGERLAKVRAGLGATPKERAAERRADMEERARARLEEQFRRELENPRYQNGTMKMSNKLAAYAEAMKNKADAEARADAARNEGAGILSALRTVAEKTGDVKAAVNSLENALVG